MGDFETLRVIHIGERRQVLAVCEFDGDATRIAMPFRQIASDVLRLGSRALILSHNHPSGDPTPSRADFAATKRLAAMLDALDVRLHDHIVLGDGRSVSFRKQGWL